MMEWEKAFQANNHQSLDSVYDEFSIWFVSDEDNPEEVMNDIELRASLKEALKALPEREALLIQLYYVEELNVYEIAEVLEITTGRVSQIKKSAVRRLREHLSNPELAADPGNQHVDPDSGTSDGGASSEADLSRIMQSGEYCKRPKPGHHHAGSLYIQGIRQGDHSHRQAADAGCAEDAPDSF
jgi:predicted XRE-type DNA-binding protein